MVTKEQVLKKYFGYDSFRPGQGEIIDNILQGRDTLAILPTGAGKSICFQVPALMQPGLTIVISPLISLMRDQVAHLRQAGIAAVCVDSSMTENTYNKALYDTQQGLFRLLYTSPERLQNKWFLRFVQKNSISMVVVDEAHCVSQWGHDFRPPYFEIATFVNSLPKRPLYAAFTATATTRVRQDIISSLQLVEPKVITKGFDRPNLYFEVASPADKDRLLLNRLEEWQGQSGIIYCATRRNVELVTRLLVGQGYAAARYHAGLTPVEREYTREQFVRDNIKLVVATNAFGMGIDKGNVSFVIHYNMPANMEGYYQEAGRAGRDGKPAHCLLMYDSNDRRINEWLIANGSANPNPGVLENNRGLLQAMWDYCHTKKCLRTYILNYFGQQVPPENARCGHCSSCNRGKFSDFFQKANSFLKVK